MRFLNLILKILDESKSTPKDTKDVIETIAEISEDHS